MNTKQAMKDLKNLKLDYQEMASKFMRYASDIDTSANGHESQNNPQKRIEYAQYQAESMALYAISILAKINKVIDDNQIDTGKPYTNLYKENEYGEKTIAIRDYDDYL